MKARIAVLSAGLAVMGPVFAAGMNIKPGLWEIQHKMDMPGASMAVPPMTRQQCITAKDIAKGDEQLTHPQPRPGEKCEMKDHSHTGDTYTLKMTCTDNGSTSTVDGKVMFDSATAYHGEFHIVGTAQGRTMHMTEHVSARRVGDCK